MDLKEFLSQIFLDNTYGAYIWAAAWIVAALLFKNLIANTLVNILARFFKKRLYGVSAEKLRSIISKSIAIFIFICAIYIAASYLHFPDQWELVSVKEFGLKWIIYILYGIVFGISLTIIFIKLVECIGLIAESKYAEEEVKPHRAQILPFATDLTKVIVGIIGGLIILSTLFKVNVATFVAGLGIGGLAIALAAKETLENLLGSFIIYFDKPFEIGEFIKVGGDYYTVEKVGLRSTRLRTLQQSRMTMPNKTLVASNIDNYTLRTFRRADRIVQLSRDTSHTQLMGIINDLKTFLGDHHLIIADSYYVNFHEIGSSSLDMRVQYYVDTDQWEVYLEVVEEVNLKILELIETHDSQLAFPTRNMNILTDGLTES